MYLEATQQNTKRNLSSFRNSSQTSLEKLVQVSSIYLSFSCVSNICFSCLPSHSRQSRFSSLSFSLPASEQCWILTLKSTFPTVLTSRIPSNLRGVTYLWLFHLFIRHAEECTKLSKSFFLFFLILPLLSCPDSVIYCFIISKIYLQLFLSANLIFTFQKKK